MARRKRKQTDVADYRHDVKRKNILPVGVSRHPGSW
jgi:hypothetical protein